MKAAAIDGFGPPSVLGLHHLPIPEPGPDEILIALTAAGVGVWDAEVRDGSWQPAGKPKFPFVLGTDGAGMVAAKGARVRRFNVGERVWAYSYANPKGGFYAEFVAVKARDAGRVPKHLGSAPGWRGAYHWVDRAARNRRQTAFARRRDAAGLWSIRRSGHARCPVRQASRRSCDRDCHRPRRTAFAFANSERTRCSTHAALRRPRTRRTGVKGRQTQLMPRSYSLPVSRSKDAWPWCEKGGALLFPTEWSLNRNDGAECACRRTMLTPGHRRVCTS